MGGVSAERIESSARWGFVEETLDSIVIAADLGDFDAVKRTVGSLRRALRTGEAATSQGPVAIADGVVLTGREVATLRRLVDGSMSQKGIAEAMGVSRNTLKTHLKSLYLKLGAHCRGEAIERARELGLLSPSIAFIRRPDPDHAASMRDVAV